MYLNNLLAEPFNLPKPQRCVQSHPEIEPDSTCVWVIDKAFKAALLGDQWFAS